MMYSRRERTVPRRFAEAAAGLLLTVLLLVGTVLPVLAAETGTASPEPLDLSNGVSLTVTPGSANLLEDLAGANLVLDVYRVAAAVQEGDADSYTFEMTNDFSSLTVGTDVTAEDWRTLAQAAAAIVQLNASITPVTVTVPVTGTTAGAASVPVSGPGLYLVIAHGSDVADYWTLLGNSTIASIANTDVYEYHFLPELIALPGRYSDVLDDGSPNLNMSGNDMGNLISWKYDVSASLKPDRETRTGSIRIIKTLTSYENSAPATFVFDVEAVLNGENVYSNVVTMTFDAAGEQSYLLGGLPIGAVVTVTEVYTGANYKLVTDAEQTATVLLDQISSVSFTNEYDNKTYGGGSIVNTFTYSESSEQNWSWTQTFDR